jgi:hypothetical protein
MEISFNFGIGSLWLLGWFFYQQILSLFCFGFGAHLYAFYTTITKGDVPLAYREAIDVCYNRIRSAY